LALIDVPKEPQIAPLKTRKNDVRIRERVFALGFPLGLNKSITQGLVSSETEKLVQFDAAISSGNSGGPLVDKDGAPLGVVTAGSTSSGDEIAQNLNFAIKTAFIPKAELFKEPIVRFYDAWRELVKIENKPIDELQDLRVFDVEPFPTPEFDPDRIPGSNPWRGYLLYWDPGRQGQTARPQAVAMMAITTKRSMSIKPRTARWKPERPGVFN